MLTNNIPCAGRLVIFGAYCKGQLQTLSAGRWMVAIHAEPDALMEVVGGWVKTRQKSDCWRKRNDEG